MARIVAIDIRVTEVGVSVFPCRIQLTGDIADDIDWRQHQLGDELVYTCDEKFPDGLGRLCVKMVREMNLVYGAFDFVESGGEYYFLEVNPNGQWGFIEERAGMKISEAIAHLIMSAFTN